MSSSVHSIHSRLWPVPVYDAHGITLFQGEAEDIMRQLHACGERFQALVTDPPYCSGGTTARERTGKTAKAKYVLNDSFDRADFQGDQRDQRSFGHWCALWLHLAIRMMQAPAYSVTFIDRRNLSSLTDAVQVAGWRFTDILPWDKTEGGCRPCKGWFRSSQAEYVVIGLLGSLGREQERKGECLPGVLRCKSTMEEKSYHMHAKPVEIMTTLLKPLTWMHAGQGCVLDPFVGSGNTLIAARRLGLRAVGIERESANIEITLKRLQEAML